MKKNKILIGCISISIILILLVSSIGTSKIIVKNDTTKEDDSLGVIWDRASGSFHIIFDNSQYDYKKGEERPTLSPVQSGLLFSPNYEKGPHIAFHMRFSFGGNPKGVVKAQYGVLEDYDQKLHISHAFIVFYNVIDVDFDDSGQWYKSVNYIEIKGFALRMLINKYPLDS